MRWPVFRVRPETFTWDQVKKIRETTGAPVYNMPPDGERSNRTPRRQWWYMSLNGSFTAQSEAAFTNVNVPTLRADVVKRIFKLN